MSHSIFSVLEEPVVFPLSPRSGLLGFSVGGGFCHVVELFLGNDLWRWDLRLRYADGLELGSELPVRGGAFAGVACTAEGLVVPLLVRTALGPRVFVVAIHQVNT